MNELFSTNRKRHVKMSNLSGREKRSMRYLMQAEMKSVCSATSSIRGVSEKYPTCLYTRCVPK